MRLWESLHHMLGPESEATAELDGYRHIGGQVLDVVQKLDTPDTPPTALAYIFVARGLELAADGLVGPYLDARPPEAMPGWIRALAMNLYRPIPELVTAAKQEAIDPEGDRDVELPWVLKGRVILGQHDARPGLSVYGQAVKQVMEWVEVTLADGPAVKSAQLYFAEATTNFDSASHLLWGFDGREPPVAVRQSTDDYLWTALAYALGSVEEHCCPGVFGGLDIDTVLEGGDVSEGHLKVLAFDRSGHTEAVRDIARAWRQAMGEDGSPSHPPSHHRNDEN